MKLSADWIRDFVEISVDDRRLAEDLTNVGIGVEGIIGTGADTVFEVEIGTNRPDAMNHYGVSREAAAVYGVELKALAAFGSSAAAEAADSRGADDAALRREVGHPRRSIHPRRNRLRVFRLRWRSRGFVLDFLRG